MKRSKLLMLTLLFVLAGLSLKAQDNALTFSSASTYAQVASYANIIPTAALTLEAWVYPTSWRTNSYEGSIINKEEPSGNTGYMLRCGATGTLSFNIGIGGVWTELLTSTNALTLNVWQHIAGVYDGATMKIYVNGALVASKNQTGAIGTSTTRALEIGRSNAYTDRYFPGRIDEVRIWNAALNMTVVSNWYNKTVVSCHPNYANLVGYWEMNNMSVPTTLVATVGNNGTVGGATYAASGNTLFNPACTGAPTTQATAIVFSGTTSSTTTATWTKGNGYSRAVFMALASAGTAAPVNNTNYTANTIFGSGTQIGSTGWYCVYNGSGNTVTVTGLTTGSTYRVHVIEYNYCSCSPLTIYYNTATGATNNPNNVIPAVSYCTTGLYTTGCSSGDVINNITISNLNQTTVCTGGTGIADYTGTTVNFAQNTSYPFTITCTYTSSEYTGWWIDFNDNGSFGDAGEFIGSSGPGGGTITGSVTIPAAAATGNHRMRVRLVYATAQSLGTSCTAYTYGETHDYTANISACTTPATQASAISFSSTTSTSTTIGWTNGSGSSRAVFMYLGSAGSAAPVNGTTYTANTVFGSGTQIGASGWYCVYNGTGTTVSVSGLTPNSTYRVHVVEYNCAGTSTMYNTATATNNPNNVTTPPCAMPTTQATAVTFTGTAATTTTISWTIGNGGSRAVFMMAGSTGTSAPVNGTTYTANTVFGTGSQIGTSGWYCVYNGTGNTVTVTGLAPTTTYIVHVVEYNCTGASIIYNTGTGASNNPNTVTTTVITYCTSSASSSGDEDITLVQFGSTLNNSSACASLVGSQGNATGTADLYSDFSAIAPTTVFQGSTIPITVTVTECLGTAYSHNVVVYIDFNKNGTLNDAGESFNIWPYASSNTHTITYSIAIPGTATLGTTKMRIVCRETTVTGPCTTDSWGETEDYTVNIAACAAPTIQASGVNFTGTTNSSTTINWTNGNGSAHSVFMLAGSSGSAAPVNGTTYTANATFGSGSQIGASGWYCVYNGTGSSVTVGGLATFTTYRVMVIESNCTGTLILYNTSTATNNPNNVATICPTPSGCTVTTTSSCNNNGTITVNGCTAVIGTDFSSTPSNLALSGNASNTGGELILTTATGSQLGSAVVTKPPAPSSNLLHAEWDLYIGGGSAPPADGYSFSYGDDAIGGGGEMGSGTKLIVSFDSYTNGTGGGFQYGGTNNAGLYIVYGGTVYTYNASTAWRTGAYQHVILDINNSGQLSLSVGGTAYFTNYALPAAYLSADKSIWKLAFSARTGGLYDMHKMDNLYINVNNVEYSIDGGVTYQSSNTFTGLGQGNYTIFARYQGITGCWTVLGPYGLCCAPDITGTTGASRCDAGTVNLSATASGGTVQWWSTATGGTTPLATGNSYSPYVTSTTIFYVDAISGTCTTSARTPVTATVNTSPVITGVSATPSTICSGSTSQLLVTTSGGGGGGGMPTGYCASSSSFQDETITNVTFNGASNSSGWAAYTDYTSNLLTTVNPGNTYSLAVSWTSGGSYPEYLRAFFDWDRNGTFESSYLVGSGTSGSTTWSTTITVPAGASQGETRMRISLKYSSDITSCETAYGFGEVEDYKIVAGASYAYNWSPSGTLNNAAIANPVASPSITTTYNCTVSLGGCSATGSTTVNVYTPPANPAPTASPTSICPYASVTLSASVSGSTIYWYTGSCTTGTMIGTGNTLNTIVPSTTTYYARAKDDVTNCWSANCGSVTVTTSDNINPTITCPGNVNVQCPGDVPAPNTSQVTASDNCPSILYSVGAVAGNTPYQNGNLVSGTPTACDCPAGYVAVGYAGNVGSLIDRFWLRCRQLNPDGTLGSTVTVTCNNGSSTGGTAVGPFDFGTNQALVGVHVRAGDNYDYVQGYGQSIAYIASGGSNSTGGTMAAGMGNISGGTDRGTQYAPNGNVIVGMYVYPTTYASGAAWRYAPLTVSYSTSPAITWVGDVDNGGAGSPASPKIITRTYKATDGSGNTATCAHTITVIDDTPPVLTCPANITVNNDNNQCGALVTYSASATDNCTSAISGNLLINPGAELGNTSGWTITQSGGNGWALTSESHSGSYAFIGSYGWDVMEQTVDLIAAGFTQTYLNTSPAINVSEWYKSFSCCSATDRYYFHAELLNASSVVIATYDFGSQSAPIASTQTWQQVAHAFTGYPAGVRYVKIVHGSADNEFWAGNYATVIDDAEVRIATGLSVNFSIAPGSFFAVGTTTVTATATDNSNNSSSCSFTVTVNDIQQPVISCVGPQVKNTDPSVCTYTVVGNAFDPIATSDNCAFSIINNFNFSNTLAGAVFPKGTTTVTWTITDASGNSSTCNFTVIVNDLEAPTIITCVGAQTKSTDPGVCTYTAVGTEFDATWFENCPGAYMQNDYNLQNTLAGAIFPKGVTTVNWTVHDASGNSSACSFAVTVNDNENPTIVICPGNQTVNTDPGLCTYTTIGAQFDPYITDNCPGVYAINDLNQLGTLDGYVFPKGTTVGLWTVYDEIGNTSICNLTVTVEDNETPTITCPQDQTRYNDELDCGYTTVNGEFDPTFGDNCPGSTIMNDYSITNTLASVHFGWGPTLVTWTVTDASLNTQTCSFTVTVNDNEIPQITCPSDITLCSENSNFQVITMPYYAWDNCGIQSVVTDQPLVFPAGITTVTWTVTDIHSNTNTCAQVVTQSSVMAVSISQASLPIFCQGEQVELTANVTGTPAVAYLWSTGEITPTIHVGVSGTYSVTVTNILGCQESASFATTIDITNLLSSYVIVSQRHVELKQNTVLSGGLGVINDDHGHGKIDVKEKSLITAAGTFVKSSEVHIDNSSLVSTVYLAPADLTMPGFEAMPYHASINVNVPNGTVMYLNDTLYKEVKIGKNATAIFTKPVVNIEKHLKMEDGSTIRFATCAKVRTKENIEGGKNITINPDGTGVVFYIGHDGKFKEGAHVTGVFIFGQIKHHSEDTTYHHLRIEDSKKDGRHAEFTGMFFAEDVHSGKYTTWQMNPLCNFCNPQISKDLETASEAANVTISSEPVIENYPNPFEARTSIVFTMPADDHVNLQVFDIAGKHVQTLYDADVNGSEQYKVEFDGSSQPTGIYIYRLTTNEEVFTGKMILNRK